MTEPGAGAQEPGYGYGPPPAAGQMPAEGQMPGAGQVPGPPAPYTPGEFAPGAYAPPQPHDQMARVFQAESMVNAGRKDSTVAYLLWFFLGGLGAHRFYMGRTGSAIGMLLLTVISLFLTVILIGFAGLVVAGIWWLVDAFLIPGWIREHNDRLRRQAYGAATA